MQLKHCLAQTVSDRSEPVDRVSGRSLLREIDTNRIFDYLVGAGAAYDHAKLSQPRIQRRQAEFDTPSVHRLNVPSHRDLRNGRVNVAPGQQETALGIVDPPSADQWVQSVHGAEAELPGKRVVQAPTGPQLDRGAFAGVPEPHH